MLKKNEKTWIRSLQLERTKVGRAGVQDEFATKKLESEVMFSEEL